MKIIKTVEALKLLRKSLPEDHNIGFVPTMGNLHGGHESLLQRARSENKICFLSIFVNPTQFNHPQDFNEYPITLEQDLTIAQKHEMDYVFVPTPAMLYPDQYAFKIMEASLSTILEGAHRPGHFEGMMTVVMKLFLLVRPDRAYFGEKDYQQLVLIQQLVRAFLMDITIIPCKTVRSSTGLALSSRNGRFDPSGLEKAALLSQALHSGQALPLIRKNLVDQGFEIEYLEIWQNRLLAAVKLNNVRLIDNIALD